MNVVTIKRIPRRPTQTKSTRTRRSFRELTRGYFASEKRLEFIVEALLFAVIIAISAWPIVAAASAINALL